MRLFVWTLIMLQVALPANAAAETLLIPTFKYEVEPWAKVGAWSVKLHKGSCVASRIYNGAEATILEFAISNVGSGNGQYYIRLFNQNWTTGLDKEYDLSYKVDGNDLMVGQSFSSVESGISGFYAEINDSNLNPIYSGNNLIVRRGQSTFANLSLVGSASALNELRRCYKAAIARAAQRLEGVRTAVVKNPFAENAPSVRASNAQPRSSPADWFTRNDYPPEALAAGQAGTVAFRLTVGADGKVSNCVLISSSGWPTLDEKTCSLIFRRARFSPARDENGEPIVGSYTNSVVWRP